MNQVSGDSRGGINDLHVRPGNPLYDISQEGVMGASQDYSVGPVVQEWLEALTYGFFGFRTIENPSLD